MGFSFLIGSFINSGIHKYSRLTMRYARHLHPGHLATLHRIEGKRKLIRVVRLFIVVFLHVIYDTFRARAMHFLLTLAFYFEFEVQCLCKPKNLNQQ